MTRHSHKQDTAFLLLSSLVKAPWVKGTEWPLLSGQWCTDGGECIGQISSRGHYRKTVTEIKTPLQTGRYHDRRESMGEAGVTVKDSASPFPPTPAFIVHRNILTLLQTPARTMFSTDNWEPECLDIYDMYTSYWMGAEVLLLWLRELCVSCATASSPSSCRTLGRQQHPEGSK